MVITMTNIDKEKDVDHNGDNEKLINIMMDIMRMVIWICAEHNDLDNVDDVDYKVIMMLM